MEIPPPQRDPHQEAADRMIAAAHGNHTMALSDAEIERAWEIKHAVEGQQQGDRSDNSNNSSSNHGAAPGDDAAEVESEYDHPIAPMSDFIYLQFAMFCPPDEPLPNILHRISMFQACKRQYGIVDTIEQGIEMLERGVQLMPGFLIAIEYVNSSQNYLSVEDWSKFFPSNLQTDEQFRIFIGLLYYKSHAKVPYAHAIRTGTSTIIECKDMTLEDNVDMDCIDRMFQTFWRWYPRKKKEVFWVNSHSVQSHLWGLYKRHLTPNQVDAMKFGYQVPGLEGERVDPLYKSPTEEIAIRNMLAKARSLLTLRYHYEQNFFLPPLPAPPQR